MSERVIVDGKDVSQEEETRLRYFSADKEEKLEPIGLIPNDIWAKNRITEIRNAVSRYKNSGKEIPISWTLELSQLESILKPISYIVEELVDELVKDGTISSNKKEVFKYIFMGAVAKGSERAVTEAMAKIKEESNEVEKSVNKRYPHDYENNNPTLKVDAKVDHEKHLQKLKEIVSNNKELRYKVLELTTVESLLDFMCENSKGNEDTIREILNYIIQPIRQLEMETIASANIESLYSSFIESLSYKYKEYLGDLKKIVEDIPDFIFKTTNGNIIKKDANKFVSILLKESDIKHEVSKETAVRVLTDAFVITKEFKYDSVDFGPGIILRSTSTSDELIKLINKNNMDFSMTDGDYLFQFAKSKIPPALLQQEGKTEREVVIDFVKIDVLKKGYGCNK